MNPELRNSLREKNLSSVAVQDDLRGEDAELSGPARTPLTGRPASRTSPPPLSAPGPLHIDT